MRVLLLVLGFLLLQAAPAHAHAGGLSPTDSLSRVTEVDPPLPGVRAAMVNHGTQLEIRNGGPTPLTVDDRVVAPGEVLRYRDERTAATTWEVPIGPAVVRGRVDTAPGPDPLPWLLGTAALAVGGWFLGRSKALLAAGVVLVTAAHVVHAIGSVLAVTGQSFAPLLVGAAGVGLVCWPLAVAAVVAAARRRPATAFIAAVVGAMLVVAGIPDFDSFRFSQLPFAGPADLDRLLVALTLGGGLGLAAGGFAHMRRDLAL